MKIQNPTLTNMQKTTSPLKLVIKEIYMINSLRTLSPNVAALSSYCKLSIKNALEKLQNINLA